MGSGPDLRTFGDLGIAIVLGSEEDGAVIAAEGTWSLERDITEMTSISREPDPRWRFTDEAGHGHRWVERPNNPPYPAGGPTYELPTLYWVVTGETGHDDGCGQVDAIEEGEWRCHLCAVTVTPGTRGPDGMVKMLAGPMRWSAKVKMSAKDMMTIPRAWLDKPISVLTPAGRGHAHIAAVEPDDSMGYLYEVTLRGIGGLTWEAPDDGEG